MALKWPPVVEAWLYRDPADCADALIARSERLRDRAEVQVEGPTKRERDRYYTRARRERIRRIMRGDHE